MDRDQRIVSLVGHGLQVAGDAAVGCGELARAEATGDLLLDLGHVQVTFGAVVGERAMGVTGDCNDRLAWAEAI